MKKRRLKYTQILFAFVCMLFVFGTNAYALPIDDNTQIVPSDDTTCDFESDYTVTNGELKDTQVGPEMGPDPVSEKDVANTDQENNGVGEIVLTREASCTEDGNCSCPDGYYWDETNEECTTRNTGHTMTVDENAKLSSPNWGNTDDMFTECRNETEFSHYEYEYECNDYKGKKLKFISVDGENDDCRTTAKKTGNKTVVNKLKNDTEEKVAACVEAKKHGKIASVIEAGNEWSSITPITGPSCCYHYRMPVPFRVNDVEITGMVTVHMPENMNARLFIRTDNGKSLIYYFDGEYGSNPTLYEPTIELVSNSYGTSSYVRMAYESELNGNQPAIWQKNQYQTNKLEEDSKSFYFYILNIDNPNSKYYNRNGRYKLLSKNKTGAIGPNSCSKVQDPECEVITLSSAQNDAQGINYVKRVRFQDEYYDVLVYTTYAYNIYLQEKHGTKTYPAESYTVALTNSAASGNWTMVHRQVNSTIPIQVPQISRYLKPTKTIVKKMVSDRVESTITLLDEINSSSGEKQKYLDLDTWNELDKLKETAGVNVYGGYNASGNVNIGDIVYNQLGEPNEDGLVAGSWIYKQKRQPLEISQAYLLYPTVKYEERTYTVCIGKYNCECEDINVLCSCEDEEAGCPPDIGAPEGSGDDDDGCPQGPVADNYGADETNPKVYNEKGMSVLSGGCGGITGKGSTDYMDKYLTIGSTIIQ